MLPLAASSPMGSLTCTAKAGPRTRSRSTERTTSLTVPSSCKMPSSKRRPSTTVRSASTTSTSTCLRSRRPPSTFGTRMRNLSETNSSPLSQRLSEALDKCNRTELYQLCKRAGLQPPTAASRSELIQYLGGELEPPKETNEIDLWRRGLKGFVWERWAVLQPQLTCPIRQDINACRDCLDTQVVTCVVEQRDCEPLIQMHRKRH